LLLELGIAIDVGARGTLPAPAQAGEALAQIQEERLPLLLAVVADVDAGRRLLRHDRVQRVAAGGDGLGRVDRLAARARYEQAREALRARQAAGMRGEDALGAAPHYLSRPVFT